MNADEICKNAFTKHLSKNPKYPDDRVVAHVMRFLSSRPHLNRKPKGLDIGCGIGRHMNLLDNLGFDAYGIDYADNAANVVAENLPQLQKQKIWQGDYRSFGFPTTFDLVIAWGVIFLCRKHEVMENMRCIYQNLEFDGQLIVNFRTLDNWFYGLGTPVGNETFLLDERAGAYAGYLYSFFHDLEVEEIAKQVNFKVIDKEKLELTNYSSSEKKHSWLIYRLKK